MGIDELKDALLEAAEQSEQSRRVKQGQGPFRMAIDRVFTMAGHGTVVTGSVSSGKCCIGDQLTIEPDSIEVRVRGLQNHDRVVEQVERGQRAAINLAGIHHEQVRRGQELATRNHLVPSRLLTARIDLLATAPRPLKNRAKVRLHIGTAEVLATVSLLESDLLAPGQSALAQMFLAEPVVATWNQPFVLRSESPVDTIAGGHLLVPGATKIRRVTQTELQNLADLQSDDAAKRAAAAIYFAGSAFESPADLARTAGIADGEDVFQQLLDSKTLVQINRTGQKKLFFHSTLLDEAAERIRAALGRLHDQHSLKSVFDRSTLANQFSYLGGPSIFDAILNRMDRQRQVRLTANGVGLADRGPQLSKGEQELLRQIIAQFQQAGFQPPGVKEVEKSATKNQKSVPQLISLAATDGDLVEIDGQIYLHRDVEQKLRAILTEELADGRGMTLSEIRERLQTTRKYAVPICEYLDRIGFTERDGDLRRLSRAAREATV